MLLIIKSGFKITFTAVVHKGVHTDIYSTDFCCTFVLKFSTNIYKLIGKVK